MDIEDSHRNIQGGIILRAYMPVGYYPKKAIIQPDSAFVLNEHLIFSAVRFKVVEIEEYYIEREWVIPEEIKLLSSITLSVEDEIGKVYAYKQSEEYSNTV